MLEDDMKKLGQLISRGEMDKARRLTHNFKGVAGTLGLVETLKMQVKTFHHVLRDIDDLDD
jgi:hypothetical protein